MLTHRGASALTAVVLFSFISWLSGNPALIIGSLTLVFIFLIEISHFNFNLGAVRKLKAVRYVGDSSLRVGTGTDVRLSITNPTRRSTNNILITDRIPEAFTVSSGSPEDVLRVKGHGEAAIAYSLNALQMGEYEIGELTVASVDPLGLAAYTTTLPVKSKVHVYPRLILTERFKGTIQSLDRTSMGQKATSKPGLGSDFRSIREYSAGDDFKSIAWKAIAKSPRHSLMTREFESDRSFNLVLVLHGRESLLDGAVGHRKLDYAVEATVALTRIASLEGDTLSFAYGDQYYSLAVPGESKQRQLVRALRSTYNLLPTQAENTQTLVQCLQRRVKRHSLIVVITDSECCDPKEFTPFSQLLGRHSIKVLAMKTSSLFSKPNFDREEVRIGYEIVTLHEERILQRMSSACIKLGMSVRTCEPKELLSALYNIYVTAKSQTGLITV